MSSEASFCLPPEVQIGLGQASNNRKYLALQLAGAPRPWPAVWWPAGQLLAKIAVVVCEQPAALVPKRSS